MKCPKCSNQMQPTGAIWGEGYGYECQGCGMEVRI